LISKTNGNLAQWAKCSDVARENNKMKLSLQIIINILCWYLRFQNVALHDTKQNGDQMCKLTFINLLISI
jgi:hypothetical protein